MDLETYLEHLRCSLDDTPAHRPPSLAANLVQTVKSMTQFVTQDERVGLTNVQRDLLFARMETAFWLLAALSVVLEYPLDTVMLRSAAQMTHREAD